MSVPKSGSVTGSVEEVVERANQLGSIIPLPISKEEVPSWIGACLMVAAKMQAEWIDVDDEWVIEATDRLGNCLCDFARETATARN